MALPTQTEMFGIVLRFMQDGEARSRKETMELIKDSLGFTPEECSYKTSSGQPVYASRIGWSISYLSRAHYLDKVARGVYKINQDGIELYKTGIDGAELFKHLQGTLAEVNPGNTNTGNAEEKATAAPADETLSPVESIEIAMADLRSGLEDELLDLILSKDPDFFEKLVVDLLVRMGYGEGTVTQSKNDTGIDGIMSTDALGFDPIYTQAKRYAKDHPVGRPELQAFAGALGSITRGIFITTSSFTSNAINFASTFPHATIVLVDGNKLASLMIDYDLGVSTERTYYIKRVDIDYFEDE